MDQIYVRMIDGTASFAPVNAIERSHGVFEVLDDPEFILDDPSVLYEFYPGDIVAVEDFFDQELQYTATKLLTLATHPDRMYLRFKYLATIQAISPGLAVSEFAPEIQRVRQEIADGRFMFRNVKLFMELLARIREEL